MKNTTERPTARRRERLQILALAAEDHARWIEDNMGRKIMPRDAAAARTKAATALATLDAADRAAAHRGN